MQKVKNNKIIFNEIKEKGIISTNEYVSFLIEKKKLIINNKVLSKNETPVFQDNSNFKSIFSSILDRFSIKYHLEKKENSFLGSKINAKNSVISNYDNDPIIDHQYINDIFIGSNLEELLTQISPEYLNTNHQKLILDDYKQHLIDMFEALNKDEIDVIFIQESFKKMYSYNEIYNGQLRGQKIRHDILMFKQAFNKNPEKFLILEELIPLKLGTSVDVVGIASPSIICHSIGGKITADALKHAHEILNSRATSAKFNIKIFAKLDQNDDEVSSILNFFSKVGGQPQVNTDVSFLDEDNMTFSEWDIKNEYLKLIVPRKFIQQVVQVGNYYDDSVKESFEEKYILELLRDFEKKIKAPQISIEEKTLLIKRHNELLSYFFSKDPILIVPNGNKSYFSSIKMFIDISSYNQK